MMRNAVPGELKTYLKGFVAGAGGGKSKDSPGRGKSKRKRGGVAGAKRDMIDRRDQELRGRIEFSYDLSKY